MLRSLSRALAVCSLIPAIANAAGWIYRPVFNVQTGRPDLVTPLSTSTVQSGSNVTVSTNTDGSITISATGGGGGGSPNGSINNAAQNSVPYYSIPVSSNVLSGSSEFQFDGTTVTVNTGVIDFRGTNMFMGYQAGKQPSSGVGLNIGIGNNNSNDLTTGFQNIGIGYVTHERITTGNNNTSVGNGAGPDIISGSRNTCIGGGNDINQPCQGVLTGSSNTMVGAGSGAASEDANSSGNSFFGYAAGAGGGVRNYDICIGYNCTITGSNRARIGGPAPYDVTVDMSSMTVSSATVQKITSNSTATFRSDVVISSAVLANGSAGTSGNVFVSQGYGLSPQWQTLSGSGIVSPGTFTWSNPKGLSVSTITVTTLANQDIPYSNSGALTGTSGSLTWTPASNAMAIGQGGPSDNNSLTINTDGSSNKAALHLNATNGDHNAYINFEDEDVVNASYGVLFDGSNYYHRWRLNGTADKMTLDTTGKLNILYQVAAGSTTGSGLTTCGDSTHALGYTSTTGLFSCQSITGSGGGGGSSLEVMVGGIRISSPTPTVAFSSDFTGTLVAGTTAAIAMNPLNSSIKTFASSVTVANNGGITVIGSGAGKIAFTEGTNSTPTVTGVSTIWADSTSHLLKLNLNGGASTSTVVGSSTSVTAGNCAKWDGTGYLSDAGAACGSGSGGGGYALQPATVTVRLDQGATGASITATSSITVTGTAGIRTSGPVVGTTFTFIGSNYASQVTSNTILTNTTFYQDGTVIMGPTTAIPSPTDFRLLISSANGTNIFSFTHGSHFISSGTYTPALTSCGTTPAITGSDLAFTITGGTGATGCIATFATAFATTPVCQVGQETMSLVNAISYTVSSTAVTITQTGLGTNKLDVICIGNKG